MQNGDVSMAVSQGLLTSLAPGADYPVRKGVSLEVYSRLERLVDRAVAQEAGRAVDLAVYGEVG
jgi:hypothetical protein